MWARALLFPAALAMLALGRQAAPAAEPPFVRPILIWNADDVAKLKVQIAAEPWAKQALQQMLNDAPRPADRAILENYFLQLVAGDQEAEKFEKQVMLHFGEMIASPKYAAGRSIEIGAGFRIQNYDLAFRYDLYREALSADERRVCDAKFNEWVANQLKNEYPGGWENPHALCNTLLALGTLDKRLIQAAFEARSGVKAYFDALADGCFTPDGGNPDSKNLGAMWLWCRAVERLGMNELGFGYVGAGGGTMRKLLEGCYLAADPPIDVPGGRPFIGRSIVTLSHRLRQADFFDLPTGLSSGKLAAASGGVSGQTVVKLPKLDHPRDVFRAPLVLGRLPNGADDWPRLLPFRNELFYSYDKKPRDLVGMPQIEYNSGVNPMSMGLQTALVFELAHQRWPDAGFDYFLCRMAPSGTDRYLPSLFWGLSPIDPANTRPPPMKSVMYPGLGMAILRAEEGQEFWRSPAPQAVLRLTDGKGDETAGSALALHSLHAFQRPIYRYLKTPRGVPPLGASGQAHNTVVVDNGKRSGLGKASLQRRFDSAVKFVAVRSVPDGESAIVPGVEMERCLALCREYLFDVYRLTSQRAHTYDWMVHALGSAEPDQPAEWRPSDGLTASLGIVQQEAVGHQGDRFTYSMKYSHGEQREKAAEQDWSLSVVQSSVGGGGILGKAWYDRKVGVRVSMLGEPGTRAFFAREIMPRRLSAEEQSRLRDLRFPKRLRPVGSARDDYERQEIPIPPPGGAAQDEPARPKPSAKEFVPVGQTAAALPETGGVAIVAERRAADTMFVALHEPFENAEWKIDQFRRVAQTGDAVAVAVRGRAPSPVDDRLLVRLGARAEEPVTLGDGQERFTFRGFAYVRISPEEVAVSGELTAMKLKVSGSPKLIINGRPQAAEVRDGWLSFQ